jgi:heme/copper-type cytochrome/quinol oxidase subunit 2
MKTIWKKKIWLFFLALIPIDVMADVPVPYQIGFQDPATEFVEGIIDLHHDVFGYLVFISIFVFYMLGATVFLFRAHYNSHPPIDLRHHTVIEIIWTIIPTLIIIAIAIPSFVLIYAMDELIGPQITIKAIGNQWYWNYEYTDMYLKVPAISQTTQTYFNSALGVNLYRNIFFNFFNFVKYSNRKGLDFITTFANTKKHYLLLNLKPHLYSLELFVCSLYLRKNFSYNDVHYPLQFIELYNYKNSLNFEISEYFKLSENKLSMFKYLYFYLKLHTFNSAMSFFNNKLVINFFDHAYSGSYSNNFFSKFIQLYAPFSFFLEGDLRRNFILKHEPIFFLYNIFGYFKNRSLCDTNLNLIWQSFLSIHLSKYNWLHKFLFPTHLFNVENTEFDSFSSIAYTKNCIRHSFFNSYSFYNVDSVKNDLSSISFYNLSRSSYSNFLFYWPTLLSLKNDKLCIKSLSDFLILYSYSNSTKIPISIKIESRMLDNDIVEQSYGHKFRLLSVDRPVLMPTGTQIRFLATANDVLHSWTIPSFGVKIDACPGRLNQVGIYIKRDGIFYGQCSEICGVNHGFMPIEVRAYKSKDFLFWVSKIVKKSQQ